MGPYEFPPYDIDRYEVTNREFQAFVDRGGYEKPQYWPAEFHRDGQTLNWNEAMSLFRDTTDRPGPSTWAGGHYPEGQANFPVSGVSWFEAAAYAAWAGKALPVLGQWYQAANSERCRLHRPSSAISLPAGPQRPARTGDWETMAPMTWQGTSANGSRTQSTAISASSSAARGSRRIISTPVRKRSLPSTAPIPMDSAAYATSARFPPQPHNQSNASPATSAKYKPVSDDVFRAYKLLYAYPNTPLNAADEGVVKETADWREQKVTFDTAYNGERMAAYLFLPKRVRPPYQTVLFFPSARVLFLPPDSSNLGDVNLLRLRHPERPGGHVSGLRRYL